MRTFAELKKNLKKDFTGLIPVKIALLGDTATQFLLQALKGDGYNEGLDLQIWEADFNQVERQVFDDGSELYKYKPDIILLFFSTHKLLDKYNKSSPAERYGLAQTRLQLLEDIRSKISERLTSKVICYNYPETDDAVFGSYANKIESSFLFQLRRLNFGMMEFAIRHAGFFICDISSLQNQSGKKQFFQSPVYINTEMVLSLDILPAIAGRTTALIKAMYGRLRKCLILDLDNTLWGGVIGDDGIENIQLGSLGIGKAFTEFQYWVKKLKQRGIIIAVCSKNTESVAKEPFEKHPDMALRLEDIAVFVANWENKPDNIRQVQSILNIGFDSMVFLDDNPFERNIVRENIPGIVVPELPEDPAEYLEYLYTLNLFETISFSEEDAERTKQYQVEAERTVLQKKFTNEDDFLQSLNMLSAAEPFNKFNTPRAAQLSQRSNQFNLRTVRYTEADIISIAANENFFSLSFTLQDKFGDHGLICAVILQKESRETLFIDTWFMSCRVLKRTMENFVLNTIVQLAADKGFRYLKGEYVPTAKNEMVSSHYPGLGFEKKEEHWLLDVSNYQERKSFINLKKALNG